MVLVPNVGLLVVVVFAMLVVVGLAMLLAVLGVRVEPL
jgi:ABC-type polysaccharide/polyol phosphate export permease